MIKFTSAFLRRGFLVEMSYKIKPQYSDQQIGFAGLGNVKLKDHKQEDLEKLLLIGLKANDPGILGLFEGQLPSLATLQKKSVMAKLNEQ